MTLKFFRWELLFVPLGSYIWKEQENGVYINYRDIYLFGFRVARIHVRQ